jgi:hypothetical protein
MPHTRRYIAIALRHHGQTPHDPPRQYSSGFGDTKLWPLITAAKKLRSLQLAL